MAITGCSVMSLPGSECSVAPGNVESSADLTRQCHSPPRPRPAPLPGVLSPESLWGASISDAPSSLRTSPAFLPCSPLTNPCPSRKDRMSLCHFGPKRCDTVGKHDRPWGDFSSQSGSPTWQPSALRITPGLQRPHALSSPVTRELKQSSLSPR